MALTQHLTPSRSQGLEAMIRAIRAKALAKLLQTAFYLMSKSFVGRRRRASRGGREAYILLF